jgi:hypothetical protein
MDPAQEPTQSTLENQKENDLFVWRAPSRPFKARTKEFYVTLFAIVGLVGFILFIAEGAMPVVLLIAIVFLFYILSTVVPEEIEYKITNKGIKVAGVRTEWRLMGRFWFSRRLDTDLLIIETFVIPGRLELVVRPEDIETIRKNLSSYLNEEEVNPSGLEKAADWFSSKLPGNK